MRKKAIYLAVLSVLLPSIALAAPKSTLTIKEFDSQGNQVKRYELNDGGLIVPVDIDYNGKINLKEKVSVERAYKIKPLVVNQSVSKKEIFVRDNHSVEKVNFKVDGRTALLTIDFNSENIVPTIKRTDDLLIIDMPGVEIPNDYQRNISTAKMGGVVKNVDIANRAGSGRIVLSQSELWSYRHHQIGATLVVEIKPSFDANEKHRGEPLTLNFQNMDVRAILQVLADFTGLNILTSDSVMGSMTVRLKDVPWDQALDLIIESNNLKKVQNGNVIWIATNEEILMKNRMDMEITKQEEALSPLRLNFYQLNHYKAEDMKAILEGRGAGGQGEFGFLSAKGSVGVDVRNNTIFVQDIESKLEEIGKIVARLDRATKQVLIDAKLVVVDDKFQRDLGAKFGGNYSRDRGNNNFGIGGRVDQDGNVWDGPITGAGSIGFTILNAISGNMLNIELSALEEKNRGKVISSPKILTTDNRSAEIRQGTQVPYVMPGGGNDTPIVQFKDAVLSLNVTPQVSANGRITMDLEVTKDTIGQLVNVQGGGQIPSIDTRSINTQVTINDGQTVVLGGIYEVSSRDDVSKVPLFGDIPWIGNFFKTKAKRNSTVELLIFITPHIIYDEDLDRISQYENQNHGFTLERK